MKTNKRMAAILGLSLAAFAPSLFAQLNIPSDGSDGALVITSNTVIDLSQAVTGTWSDNNSANAGKGVYDPAKWAVVFKYSSVSISNGAALTFSNHLTHAPVVWLVNGDVTINGELNLDGQTSVNNDPVNLREPGPGGFRGGIGDYGDQGHGGGFGPGGYYNDHGGYSDYHSYGNLQILPLIGGSGGSGGGWGGGGGGGAILIAASGTITVNGDLHANGGNNANSWYGSGGGIRLVANQDLGNGYIQAYSGEHPGRIRLEAITTSAALVLTPITTGVSPIPLAIWPAVDAPTVNIVSVGGQTAPTDPKAIMAVSNSSDDLTIATNSPINIVLQTANFPTNGTVNVYVKPRNGSQSIYNATLVSGTASLATWQLQTSPPVGHFVVQVRAFSP